MAKKLQSITIGELKQLLEDYNEEDMVVFSSDYGDHVHTEQIHTIKGDIEEIKTDTTAYSDSGFSVVHEDDDKWEEDEDLPEGERQSIILLLK